MAKSKRKSPISNIMSLIIISGIILAIYNFLKKSKLIEDEEYIDYGESEQKEK